MRVLAILAVLVGLGGCVSISPELVEALSRDDASICVDSDIRGGIGSLMNPAGGYGQGTLRICRSNHANAEITLGADGSMTIIHGAK